MVLLNSNELKYGELIKDFKLPNTNKANGQKEVFSNQDLNKDIVVVAFICNHCPYVVRIANNFSKLALKASATTNFVAISANDPDYREEDSPEKMSEFAKEYIFNFPYLFDESQEVAKDFGAVCTPDIFTYKKIDGEYKLVYHARFEDLEKAITELESLDEISFEQMVSAGCSIKWK